MIFGVEKFAGHAGSWRCSTSAFLAASAERIDALDVAAARRAFSVAEMADLGLYEVRPEEDDDNAFVRVLIRLREFGAHCRRVAAKDLDLIIELY